ncbi:hypothetical protein ACFQET_09500 [Levilactobacillus tangyuanensis]|uniref:XRE family transcriptional regulator n=1 Tax=Levilactobacillus tangyuanensis TaxID=2486021 RepID=A0ABW1TRV7_9LACO|nr:hypothetical protein [Levilactobacillus tangyuanensis]
MQPMRHTLGDLLTNARLVLANEAPIETVLKNTGIPSWYLAELEKDHIARPNPDFLTLILQCYELTYAQAVKLRQTDHITSALSEMAYYKHQRLVTYQQQQEMQWPDSAEFAKQHSRVEMPTPDAVNSYADIMRCVRVQIEWHPVAIACIFYRVSPMEYWQMEAEQLYVTPSVIHMLCHRLEVPDLDELLAAPDLFGTICDHLGLKKESLPTTLRMPGE